MHNITKQVHLADTQFKSPAIIRDIISFSLMMASEQKQGGL